MSQEEHLSADRPVEEPAGDKLGYSTFAEHLANTLTTALPKEGFVVAINAPWGAGKTTLLNLVRHYLKGMPEEQQPILLEFNPWWFSGQDLTLRFFQELIALSKRGLLASARSSLASFAGTVASVAAPIPLYGQALSSGAEITKRLLKENQTTEATKRELSAKLKKLERRILVVVDDIDRLEPNEVKALFQLIKAVADLPNLVYLLAFDKRYVTEVLTQPKGLSGDDYLEKIVQAAFELPEPESLALQTMFLERLNLIYSEVPDEDFDETRWSLMYSEGIKPLLNTPRKVVRLLSSLSVTYPSVQGEVNPIDFLSLECLRLFCTPAYEAIRRNKDAFVGPEPGGYGYSDSREKERLKDFHDAWVLDVSEEQRAPVESLVNRMFPKFEGTRTGHSEHESSAWRTRRRLCHPDIYPVYFRLAVPIAQISRAEMLELLGEPSRLCKRLEELGKEKVPSGGTKAWQFFNMLEDYLTELEAEQAIELLTELADIPDALLTDDHHPANMLFPFRMPTMVDRSRFRLLRRITPDQRVEVLRKLIHEGNSLFMAVRTVVSLGSEHGRYGSRGAPEYDRAVPIELVDELEQVALGRIVHAAESGILLQSLHPGYLLYRWTEWAKDGEAAAFVAKEVEGNDDNLKLVLRGFSGRVEPGGIRCDPRQLKPFLPAESIIERVRALSSEDEFAAQYVREYDALKRGEDPDDPGARL